MGGRIWIADLGRTRHPPRELVVNGAGYRRILDRFYLPKLADPCVSTALFDLSASTYDRIIHIERNKRNIVNLLHIVLSCKQNERCHAGQPINILDFGCGTGLSQEVWAALPRAKRSIMKLTGVDASPAMLAAAKHRGLTVRSFHAWHRTPSRSFDAAIASFVLHCGITDAELAVIYRQLVPSGVLVANYHHGDNAAIRSLRKRCQDVGFVVSVRKTARGAATNPVFVCKRPDNMSQL